MSNFNWNLDNEGIVCSLSFQFSLVHSLSHVRLFETPWIPAQAFLSITNSRSSLKLMSMELVMLSNHLILCRPYLLLPSFFASIKIFSMSGLFASGGQSIRATVLPVNIQSFLPLGLIGLISLMSKGFARVCCIQYASKFGKLSSGHRAGKDQFSFQSQRKAMPKNAQTTAQLHSSHTLVK